MLAALRATLKWGFSDFVRPVGSNVFATENHGADGDAQASTGAGAQDGSDEAEPPYLYL